MDGISILPTLIGEAAAGHAQKQHEYLYWEMAGATALRQGDWRVIRRKASAPWELYDLASDPSESKDLAAAKPDLAGRLTALADEAHEPAVEGTFARTDRHERDRRAKTGQHDQPAATAPSGKAKARTRAAARHSPCRSRNAPTGRGFSHGLFDTPAVAAFRGTREKYASKAETHESIAPPRGTRPRADQRLLLGQLYQALAN